MSDETTKKAASDSFEGENIELRPHYDFTRGVRGKYAARFAAGLRVEQFPEHARAEAAQMLGATLSPDTAAPASLKEQFERIIEDALLGIKQLTEAEPASKQLTAIREQARIALIALQKWRRADPT